jgi:hypothetical protein
MSTSQDGEGTRGDRSAVTARGGFVASWPVSNLRFIIIN